LFTRTLSIRAFLCLTTAIFAVTPVVLGFSASKSDANVAAETTDTNPTNVAGIASSPSLRSVPKLTGAAYLQLARDSSNRMFSEVENVICNEHVERYKGHRDGTNHQVDVVEAKVAVEDGEERYSEIVQNNRHRNTMQQIGGAWSEGEYATFLREARRILSSNEFITQGYLTTLNGVPAVMFPYDMDEKQSSWDFLVRAHRYMLAFHGELWISQETGELLRSRRIARHLDISTGINEVDWTVDFSKVELNGRPLCLPAKALYSVTYRRDENREFNLTSFNNYKRFGSDSTIKFAEVSEPGVTR